MLSTAATSLPLPSVASARLVATVSSVWQPECRSGKLKRVAEPLGRRLAPATSATGEPGAVCALSTGRDIDSLSSALKNDASLR
eukprot:COSAG06_NODE_1198_length_10303_cov_40.587319_4_plen_84_part_00